MSLRAPSPHPGQATNSDGLPYSLRANFSWTLAGNIVYYGSQWGVLALIAKLSDAAAAGRYALALAIVTPVMLLANLQLRAVLATDSRQRNAFRDYLAVRVITTLLAVLGLCVFAWAANRWEITVILLWIAAAKIPESISDIFYGLMQQ